MYFAKTSFILISTDSSFAVPQQNLEQDSGVYLLLYAHGYFSFHNRIHTSTDEDIDVESLLSSSKEFIFIPLDADRLRAEIFLLIRRLAKMFVNDRIQVEPPPDTGDDHSSGCNTTITMEDNFCWNGENIAEEKTSMEKHKEKVKGIPLPKSLDYSFLGNIIEVGDEIQYKERSGSSLINDAVITSINLDPGGKTTTVQLNNGDKIINSLHLVRRITMRSVLTKRVQYNPISEWKELHTIHMNPGTVPESGTFDILNAQTECEDDDGHQDATSTDENNCTKVDETGEINPPDVANKPEMENPSGIEGREAWRLRRTEAKREKRRNEGLDKTRTGKTGQFLNWLADSKLGKEIAEVNALYRSFSIYGKFQELSKMMKATNNKEYKAAKKAAKKKLINWEKTRRVVLPIVLPLVYFACYTSALTGLTHDVQVDSDYDQMQTNREFERREKILEFENTMSMTRVLTCSTCMENKLNSVQNEIEKGTAHECSGCKNKKKGTG